VTNAILVINTGSSSVKFACFAVNATPEKPHLIHRGIIGNIGAQAYFSISHQNGQPLADVALRRPVTASHHERALAILFDWLDTQASDLRFVAVGHRVVHGADWFCDSVPVDAAILNKLEELVPLAPMHQPYNLAGIRAMNVVRPGMLQVACFDTAFHQSQPAIARMFALPRELTDAGIKRYGFHGLSYEHIAQTLPEYLGSRADGRVIVAHLGNGASMCAIKQRKSQASTMGLTVLDGLPMGTRCGALDPGVILHLLTARGMKTSDIAELLYHKSGLLGVSGLSGDMQELLRSQNANAALAVQLFVYRIACELGALTATLGGLDALIFTGGIGENAADIRARICQHANWMGIDLDADANTGGGPEISAPNSPVSVWVIPANEELVIAKHTLSLLPG
jgi:acetate kinase